MIELTPREGDGDAARSGYWIVTGPQPEDEAYATIERALVIGDTSSRVAYAWYLNERTMTDYRQEVMHQVADGVADSFDEAMEALWLAWARTLGDGMDRPEEETGEVYLPWRE